MRNSLKTFDLDTLTPLCIPFLTKHLQSHSQISSSKFKRINPSILHLKKKNSHVRHEPAPSEKDVNLVPLDYRYRRSNDNKIKSEKIYMGMDQSHWII